METRMRAFDSPSLHNLKLSLVLSTVLIAAGVANAKVTPVQPIGLAIQIQHSTDAEGKAYEEWYRALKDRQMERIIELGESYLQEYAKGKFAEYIRRMIEFARASVDPNQRKRAQGLRSQVMVTLADSEKALGVLLRDVMNNQSDVNTKGRNGSTVLMFAAATGNREALKFLIDKQADIDATESTHGWTALIYAIWGGDPVRVKYLLAAFPDANIKDKEGLTARDHAMATGNFEMMLLISSRPRKDNT
jgi:hypothetical protein